MIVVGLILMVFGFKRGPGIESGVQIMWLILMILGLLIIGWVVLGWMGVSLSLVAMLVNP